MRITALALLLASLFLLQPATASAADGCQFVLGFKALRDAIPDRVGDCRANQSYDPSSGDAVQETTAWHGKGGLLVWRKADNWTAFTDGSTTWVNGPDGIQKRGNAERFAWEANDMAGDHATIGQVTTRVSGVSVITTSSTGGTVTVSSGDPALVVLEHSGVGRISNSQTVLASATSSAPATVTAIQTSRYGTPADAQGSFAAWRPAGWEEIAAPTVGDQSRALKRTSTSANGADLMSYCVVFRRGTLVGTVVLAGRADAVSLDDALATARATAEKQSPP